MNQINTTARHPVISLLYFLLNHSTNFKRNYSYLPCRSTLSCFSPHAMHQAGKPSQWAWEMLKGCTNAKACRQELKGLFKSN